MAAELKLGWHTVKALDQQYMEAQLKRAGTPSPQVIGIDEIAIRKGHTYRIVVSDLLRGRPIWFGGKDRSEASISEFYAWLGAKQSARIRLAVMDMWKPFRLITISSTALSIDCAHIAGNVWHIGRSRASQRPAHLAMSARAPTSIFLVKSLTSFLYPELVHPNKNGGILSLKNVPKIEVSYSFVLGESPSEIPENMTREVESEKV